MRGNTLSPLRSVGPQVVKKAIQEFSLNVDQSRDLCSDVFLAERTNTINLKKLPKPNDPFFSLFWTLTSVTDGIKSLLLPSCFLFSEAGCCPFFFSPFLQYLLCTCHRDIRGCCLPRFLSTAWTFSPVGSQGVLRTLIRSRFLMVVTSCALTSCTTPVGSAPSFLAPVTGSICTTPPDHSCVRGSLNGCELPTSIMHNLLTVGSPPTCYVLAALMSPDRLQATSFLPHCNGHVIQVPSQELLDLHP